MNDAALGINNSSFSSGAVLERKINAAGIEVNNVTEILSDHFPAFVQWQNPNSFPHGVELFGY